MLEFRNIKIYLTDNEGNENIVARRLIIATSIEDRQKGLIGMDELPRDHGILLYPCKAIHMRKVKFPIDVVYANRRMKVVRTISHINPDQSDRGDLRAFYALELPANTINFNPVRMRVEYMANN